VFLSYIIAVFGAFVSLTLASAMFKENKPVMRNLLHFGAAFSLGAGIWAMHFIGMLAFKMDMVVTYDPRLTVLSMIIAITVAFFAFLVTRSKKFNMRRVAFAAVFLGIAISGMHYTGMAAMEMDGDIRYIPSFFVLSIVIGILASGVAMSIIYYLGHLSWSH
jgi:NO-binding membrane sensor protein with MHYT domain